MQVLTNLMRSGGVGMMVAGVIVVSTPSGQSNIVFTHGAASHVTSNYSAQINDAVAGPGEHVSVTSNGTHSSEGNGKTATVTVVSK